jgi:DNA-binding response OmpR family regulator
MGKIMHKEASTSASILCIEDDLDTCEFLAILLAEFRFEFAHTVSGALPKLGKGPHDLYILDNWLPDGSGIDLCRKIRDEYPTAPIVFTSGSTKPSEIDEAMQAGANRYVLKPCEPDRLKEIVKDLILKN